MIQLRFEYGHVLHCLESLARNDICDLVPLLQSIESNNKLITLPFYSRSLAAA